MSRTLVFLALFWVSVTLEAQDLGAVKPTWTVESAREFPRVGIPFSIRVSLQIPPGYYQDADSSFLKIQPLAPFQIVNLTRPSTVLRGDKPSYSGTAVFLATIVLPTGPIPSHIDWGLGWQICQVDGVCLLPASLVVNQQLVDVPQPFPTVPAWSSLWLALLGALLGGLLLNLMPCVFPVLALKAVGLAGLALTNKRRRRQEAALFALGGWSFLTLLGLATAVLSAGGQRLDWGFTFQQPLFVWILALVFWAFSLQLAGLWSWKSSPFALTVSLRSTWATPFLGGAFLVVTAAPCTAPLLGPALGWAFSMPFWIIPIFFSVAGLGLVAPLWLLSLWPRLGKLLPRPGKWLVVVERVASLFLMATVAYLGWIVIQQTGTKAMIAGLTVLLLSAVGLGALRWRRVWIRRSVVSVMAIAVICVSALGLFGLNREDKVRSMPQGWEAFSLSRLDNALASGQSVLVDATAAWCATCQVNEATVLLRPDSQSLLSQAKVVLLRADYTLPDPEIQIWLMSVHRAGLPVYALYRPHHAPHFFPELLTHDNFTATLPRLLDLDGTRSIQ